MKLQGSEFLFAYAVRCLVTRDLPIMGASIQENTYCYLFQIPRSLITVIYFPIEVSEKDLSNETVSIPTLISQLDQIVDAETSINGGMFIGEKVLYYKELREEVGDFHLANMSDIFHQIQLDPHNLF